MSWGIKITTLYLGFVAIILTLVFICFGHKTELEYKDYYAKELKFQDQIEARTNADNLQIPIEYMLFEQSVKITLPKEILTQGAKGTIEFLRPSDASMDKTIALHTDENGVQTIEAGFIKGIYKMHIALKSGNKNYFKEAVINFK